MPMVTACLHFEVEDGDPMRTASAHSFSRIVDYETMDVVSSYLSGKYQSVLIIWPG